jgi:quinol monooxygenase YgiN/predicted kinase
VIRAPVVVTGPPGVGKSTICAELAARRRRAAHVEADALHRMIISGGEWPSSGTPTALRQLYARSRNAAQIARNLWAEGVEVFIDEVVGLPEQIRILDAVLSSAYWVTLSASSSVIAQRDAARAKHTAAAYRGLGDAIQTLLGERAIFIDTDRLDVDESVDAVEAALLGAPFEAPTAGPVWWLVEVVVRSSDLERFEALTREMVAAAGREPGTLTYERHRVDATTFHFHESYESSDAALYHLARFRQSFADRLAAVSTRQRFHLYGPANPALLAALTPYGAIAAERWPRDPGAVS